MILEKVDKEGVAILSLTELLKLKNHLSQKMYSPASSDENKFENEADTHQMPIKNLTSVLTLTAFQNEKDQLTQEIYQLRELLSKVSAVSSLVFLKRNIINVPTYFRIRVTSTLMTGELRFSKPLL